MIVVDPNTLSARDREALTRVLAEHAPLEHVARHRSSAHIAIMIGLAILLAVLGSFPTPSSLGRYPTTLVIPLWAAALGCVGLAVHWLARRRALARCPWRCGLFLHRFGAFQAEPTWVRYVPGDELDEPRFVSKPRLGVRLSARRWSATLPADEAAWERLWAQMDGLPFQRWTRCDGYRESGAPLDHASPIRVAVSNAVKRGSAIAAFASFGAFFAWLVVVPEFALADAIRHPHEGGSAIAYFERHYRRPWTDQRASRAYEDSLDVQRARIRERTEEPFRSALLALLPAGIDDGPSLLDIGSRDACDGREFMRALAPTIDASDAEQRAFDSLEGWGPGRYWPPMGFWPLGGFATGFDASDNDRYERRGALRVGCTFHADGGDLLARVRARIITHATITLLVSGREPASRTITIGDDAPALTTYIQWWNATSARLDAEVRSALGR